MAKPLSKNITSYDLLKTAALLLMFVDHAGYFFFPEEPWFRVVGRLSAPIWFFLIGYAETRQIPKMMLLCGAAVSGMWMVSGQYLFPLNNLFSLALCRIMIDRVMQNALRSYEALWGMFLLLFFTALPAMLLLDYGTLGLMFGMLGFIVRHRSEISIEARILFGFMTAVSFAYSFINLVLMPWLSDLQLAVLFLGVWILSLGLYFFRPAEFPVLTKVTGPFAVIIRLFGRRTLEIYTIHLLILAGAAMAYDPARFKPFQFIWAPPSLTWLFGS